MTKHTGMYPRTRAADENDVQNEKKDDRSFPGSLGSGPNLSLSKPNLKDVKCLCEARYRDEEQKEAVMAEIYLTYEEILQLEQALIELDEQNTTNTLEIHKRDAKTIFLIKQVEEIEEMLGSKENGASGLELKQLKEQHTTLNKQIHQHRVQVEILNESTK